MSIDPRTAIFLLAAHMIICGGLFRIVRHRLDAHPALDDWGNGAIVFGLAFLLALIVGLGRPGIAAIVVGGAQLLGASLLLRGFVNCADGASDDRWHRFGQRLPHAWLLMMLAYGTTVLLQPDSRQALLHLMLAALYGITGIVALAQSVRAALLRLAPTPTTACGGLMIGLSALTGLRLLDILRHPQAVYETAFAGPYFAISSVAVIILSCLMLWIMFAGLRQRLVDLAGRDPLTGALNRRGLQLAIDSHFSRAPAALIVFLHVDIDHFKQVNDRHGHEAGDRVLRAVGEALRSQCRSTDLVARTGGEEFVIACVGQHAAGGFTIAEALRTRIGGLAVPTGAGVMIRCTVSIGVSSPVALQSQCDDAFRQADSALYRAKTLGRNMSVAHFVGNQALGA